jgi:hypothetical protein
VNNFDLEEFKKQINSYSSQKLCDMIICQRYLHLDLNISILCMHELASRRIAGDDFDFEGYIDDTSNSLPSLDNPANITNIFEVIDE